MTLGGSFGKTHTRFAWRVDSPGSPWKSAAMKDEMILVVPRAALDALGSFQGLHFEVDRYLEAFFTPPTPRFMARPAAEEDPSFKQIIPYAIFTHAGRILSYVRGAKSGEQRLAAKRSIGIGGHMNDTDTDHAGFDLPAYRKALAREIAEELHIQTAYREQPVALLNDDSTEVGQVHLGVVHVFECESDAIAQGEAVITDLRFLSREELHAERDRLETWSQICFDQLDTLLSRASR
jgi:predicted NUDIX family phosphoesterase